MMDMVYRVVMWGAVLCTVVFGAAVAVELWSASGLLTAGSLLAFAFMAAVLALEALRG